MAAAAAAVGNAQAVLTDLEKKRAACVQHGTELADERASVALIPDAGATHLSEYEGFELVQKYANLQHKEGEICERAFARRQ